MSASRKIAKVVAKISLFIGLPFAILLVASIITILILYPPPLEKSFTAYDGYILASVVGIILLLGFIRWIWRGGKKVKTYIEKEYSLFKAGIRYAYFVGWRIFVLILFLSAGIIYLMGIWKNDTSFIEHVSIFVALVFTAFVFISFLVSITIGIMTVHAARIIVTSAKADLSLPEYAL